MLGWRPRSSHRANAPPGAITLSRLYMAQRLEQLLEMLGVVERPDQRQSELLVLDQLLRDTLHVLARHRVQPLEHLVEVRRALLEHLAPQAEQDQPLRA